MANGETPLFIHAGFRSGSTLVWSLLHRARYRTYFEPLHETLATVRARESRGVAPDIAGALDNAAPDDVFRNYRELTRQMAGVQGYRASFAYERYFMAPDESHPALRGYIESLLADSRRGSGVAAFKFVRSQGRAGWFKRNFEGRHIGIVRRPFDQFMSFVWNARRGNYYFLGVLLHIVKMNLFCGLPHFGSFVSASPIRSDHLYLAQEECEANARRLNLYQLYFIFYYVWKRCALHLMQHCEAILDVSDGGSLKRLSEILGLEIGRERIIARNSPAEISYDARFARVEALARYCLLRDGQYAAIADNLSPPSTLLPELEADRRALAGDPLGGVSEGEAFNAIGSRILIEEEDRNGLRRRMRGVAGLCKLDYNRDQAAVTIDQEGEHHDFKANTAVVGDGAVLTYDPERDEEHIRFDYWKEALVFAAHHPGLGEGLYRLILDVESAPRVDCEPTEYPRLAADVVTADGALVLLPMSSFPNRGRRLVSFEFTVAAFSLDVDIRLWAFRSAGRAYGYRLTALGRSCKVDEPLGKQNPDSAVSSKITNIDASTSTPS